jgi:hypothetical protein
MEPRKERPQPPKQGMRQDPPAKTDKASKQDKQQDKKKNQGEGNVEADRRYREQTTDFARSGKVEKAAREAEEALEGPEGDELERARRESGQRGRSQNPPLD